MRSPAASSDQKAAKLRHQAVASGKGQRELMNRGSIPPNVQCASNLRLDPALIGEEAIVLRALVAGRTDKQVRKELRMSAPAFYGLMRNIRDKTGAVDNTSLLRWAKRQMQDRDQRIDRHERHARLT
jgi:DNA-binding CsgD family transcriptional regulator